MARSKGLVLALAVAVLALGLLDAHRQLPEASAIGPGAPNIVVIMVDDLDNGLLAAAASNGVMPNYSQRDHV